MGARPLRERRLGDRRRDLRFEIVGDLWGTLEVRPTCRLINLGEGGALMESSHPIPPGLAAAIRLTAGGRTSLIPVAVRHVSSPTERGQAYRVGLAFGQVDATAQDHLRAVLKAAEPRSAMRAS